ncbi:hypothetical protein [Campylobacter jejuni]|uniref:hypothetical protein n=1 Tax=Campylobacter jejuni TaxID=197 RepID=UPI0015D5892B
MFKGEEGMGVVVRSSDLLYLKKKGGGVWVDLDMICLNYIDLNEEYIIDVIHI